MDVVSKISCLLLTLPSLRKSNWTIGPDRFR